MYEIILTANFYGIRTNGKDLIMYDLPKLSNNTKHTLLYIITNIFKSIQNINPDTIQIETVRTVKTQLENDIFYN
jgi:hypothetical protein